MTDEVIMGFNSSSVNVPYVIGRQINEGLPCAESYWCGATREELAERMARRRHVQATPTLKDVRFDPAIAATLEWQLRRLKLRLARRRKGSL